MTLSMALFKAFKREGQTSAEFNRECEALTAADRQDLANWFNASPTPGVTVPVEL
jgi:hypothetical protein